VTGSQTISLSLPQGVSSPKVFTNQSGDLYLETAANSISLSAISGIVASGIDTLQMKHESCNNVQSDDLGQVTCTAICPQGSGAKALGGGVACNAHEQAHVVANFPQMVGGAAHPYRWHGRCKGGSNVQVWVICIG